MSNEPNARAESFRFAGRLLLILLWMCIALCFIGALTFIRVQQPGPTSDGITALFVSISFVLLVGTVLLFGNSDVVIDDRGISRRLFGWTWQTIRWTNIRLITAFPVSGGYGYTARGFNIFPSVAPTVRLMPSGKMWFTDKISDAPRLVELLNHYASSQSIKIEIRDSLVGGLKAASRL
jgi:hypothetical protein